MTEHYVYLAEAGPKQKPPEFEAIELTEPEAHATTDQWYHDCVNFDDWYFSVTKMEVVAADD